MSGRIGVVGRLRAKPGKEDELAAMMAELSQLAKQHEPGMIQHAIFRSRSDPGAFTVVEVFADQAAFEAHSKTPHYPDILPRLGPLIQDQPGGGVEVLDVLATS